MKNKKLLHFLFVGFILILINQFIANPTVVSEFFGKLRGYFTIFIYAGVIAFLLNPVLNFLENSVKITRKKSIMIIYIGLIIMIIVGFYSIIPELSKNIKEIIENFPNYLTRLEGMAEKLREKIPALKDYSLNDGIIKAQTVIFDYVREKGNILLGQAFNFTMSFLEFSFGAILSIFLLLEKEYFLTLHDETFKLFSNKRFYVKLFYFENRLRLVFLNYISGKTIDSMIIGFLAYIGLTMIGAPYVLFLSVIVFLTNFIPYVGPMIGIAISSTLTLVSIPDKVLMVAIFLLILQQFDAWVLEPKILGDTLNLTSFWTISAVTLGGNIAGPIGIIVAVPLFAFIKDIYHYNRKRVLRKRREYKFVINTD